MPNHVINKLTIKASEPRVLEVKEFIKIEKTEENQEAYGVGTIDFNKITPAPPWLFQGNLGREQEKKYGPENCWYEWNRNNWGTKWNAYSQPDERNTENTIFFQTAWNCPLDLIRKLSWIFPDVEFEIAWADEDLGYNLGIVAFKDGVTVSETIPQGGTIEAKKLFFEITQDTLEEHNMNENFVYIDED